MKSPEKQFNALTPDQEQEKESSNIPDVTTENIPIAETETSVTYLGVELEKAKISDSPFVPEKKKYADYINDKDFALPFQRDLAISLANGDPYLAEGGTSLGKTTTVRKMAAELGWEIHYANFNGATDVEDFMGRYIPNPFKIDRTKTTDEQYKKIVEQWQAHTAEMDPTTLEAKEYIFADGKVTSGLRQEEGKIKVIVLDEINAASPNILIRLHEVLDAIDRGENVILSEDASEAISVDKTKTKIVAFMNPPGKGYLGLEPLSPAQIRRWVYQKLPSELPDETFKYATKSLFFDKKNNQPQEIDSGSFLRSREQTLKEEQLEEIPGIFEIEEKFEEFHKASKELLKNRKVAEDQPQPFTFDDRMEPRRVRDFVLRFYTGDINETFQQALQYYYANKLESDDDRKKLGELIRLVEYKPKTDESKRKGAERDEMTGEESTTEAKKTEAVPETKLEGPIAKQIEVAIEKLGEENVFGPKEIEKTFGVHLAEIPGIPFPVEEIERAKKLGQMLILRVDKTDDGKPMSTEAMNEILRKKWKKEGKGKLLNSADYWDNWIGRELFTKETPRLGWALVSKEILPESLNRNYFRQTEAIVNTLRDEVFEGMEMPEEYTTAIKEFESKKDKLAKLLDKNWSKVTKQINGLKITQLTRQTIPEIIYDIAMYYDKNNKRLLSNTYSWTTLRQPFSDKLTCLGNFEVNGIKYSSWNTYERDTNLGVSLSRRI